METVVLASREPHQGREVEKVGTSSTPQDNNLEPMVEVNEGSYCLVQFQVLVSTKHIGPSMEAHRHPLEEEVNMGKKLEKERTTSEERLATASRMGVCRVVQLAPSRMLSVDMGKKLEQRRTTSEELLAKASRMGVCGVVQLESYSWAAGRHN